MILVTGASGTIGQATLQALEKTGARFRVATHSRPSTHVSEAETARLDWDDLDSYVPAMRGVETLFLLTPNSERQVGYVLQAIAAAKRAGVRRIVRLSVAGADAEPGIALGRLHFAAEREIRASGLSWVALRPTFFMQNFVNYYGVDPQRDGVVRLPNGEGKLSCIDAADVGAVAARVLTSNHYDGSVLTLTGPEAVTTAHALEIIGRVLGHRYDYIDVPEAMAREEMEKAKMPLWMVDAFLELHGLVKNGYAGNVSQDVERVLGRRPRTLHDWASAFLGD